MQATTQQKPRQPLSANGLHGALTQPDLPAYRTHHEWTRRDHPIRRQVVRQAAFLEAAAINEILVSGELAGNDMGSARLLSVGLDGLYDFLAKAVHAWNASVSTEKPLGGASKRLAELRHEQRANGISALFGLGYVISLKYAAVICAGSVLTHVVLVPPVYLFGSHVSEQQYAGQIAGRKCCLKKAAFADSALRSVQINHGPYLKVALLRSAWPCPSLQRETCRSPPYD